MNITVDPRKLPRPETTTLICPEVPAESVRHVMPAKYFEVLEQNQKIASCCRHPENHMVGAYKSNLTEPAVDIYIFHCTCGRKHRRFCVGETDVRAIWSPVAGDGLSADDGFRTASQPMLQACPRVPLRAVLHILPESYTRALFAHHCECSDYDVEAHVSTWLAPAPEVYTFTCRTCGSSYAHRPAEEIDARPVWNRTIKF